MQPELNIYSNDYKPDAIRALAIMNMHLLDWLICFFVNWGKPNLHSPSPNVLAQHEREKLYVWVACGSLQLKWVNYGPKGSKERSSWWGGTEGQTSVSHLNAAIRCYCCCTSDLIFELDTFIFHAPHFFHHSAVHISFQIFITFRNYHTVNVCK